MSWGHQEHDYSVSMLDFHLKAADRKAEILLEFTLILRLQFLKYELHMVSEICQHSVTKADTKDCLSFEKTG